MTSTWDNHHIKSKDLLLLTVLELSIHGCCPFYFSLWWIIKIEQTIHLMGRKQKRVGWGERKREKETETGVLQSSSRACSQWLKDIPLGPTPSSFYHLLIAPCWRPSHMDLWDTLEIQTIAEFNTISTSSMRKFLNAYVTQKELLNPSSSLDFFHEALIILINH